MAANVTVMGDVVREGCKAWPRLPHLTLAKKLYADNPALFLSVEHARLTVKYHRGCMGKGNREKVVDPIPYTPTEIFIPPTDAKDATPYTLPAGAWVVMSDIHFPYHSPPALRAALGTAQAEGYDNCLLLGDVIDQYSLSRFDPDPRNRRWKEERDMVRRFLHDLSRHFKRVVYVGGNHEYRYHRYMLRKAPELLDVDEFQFPAVMGLQAAGVTWVDWFNDVHAGELTLLHGHTLKASAAVNPARGAFLKAKRCAVVAHYHQPSEHPEVDVRGRITTCWSLGCLCGLWPEYAQHNRWIHGFGLLNLQADGWFTFTNHKLVKDRVV